PATPEELDPQAAQKRLIGVIEKLFRSQDQPVLLILEDTHWTGIESLAVLYHLDKIMHDMPLLILASYRDDEAPDLHIAFQHMKVLKVERFNEDSIEDLAVAMLGEQGRQQALIALLERETEGNVFFVVEVLRALAEEAGKLTDVTTMHLPTHVFTGGIDKIIQRRLGRVPAEIRPMLEIAAVGGRYLDWRILHYLIQDEGLLEEWLTIAANLAVIEIQDGSWRFSHEKLREGLLNTLPQEALPDLHQQFAEAIESVYITVNDRLASLAYHWGMAGNTEKEGIYAALAGEQVLNSGAYDEAVSFLSRALELMDENPDAELAKKQGNLMRLLGSAYTRLGNHIDARPIFLQSLEIFEGVDYRWGTAMALSDLGHVTYALEDYEASYRYFRKSIETAMSVRAQKVALAGIIGIARLMHAAGRYEWAIELVAFSLDHVAVDMQTAERAQELLKILEPLVDVATAEAAKERGRSKRLSEVVEELLPE
ncbi:MAG TPA: tetratricopeptide repeat protein, partial [Aggregatilineales bacterium]|nr:tetratricopeptide repeat protein [Aggregatilineales bacterium]